MSEISKKIFFLYIRDRRTKNKNFQIIYIHTKIRKSLYFKNTVKKIF